MNTNISLKTFLLNAFKRRETCLHPCLSLVNGRIDNLPDLVLHQYGAHVMIQTTSLQSDKWISDIVSVLKETRKPKSIWLKNQCELRLNRHLPLNDQLLFGEDLGQIPILENTKTYLYPTQSRELWLLKDRTLRHHLTKWQTQKPNQKFLYVGPNHPHQLNAVLQPNESVFFQPPHWAEACESLRKLSAEHNFGLIVLYLPGIISSEKSKKALFHLLFQAIKNAQSHGEIWLRLFNDNVWILGLLQKAGMAQKIKLFGGIQISGESDFPIELCKIHIDRDAFYQIRLEE